MRLIQFEPLFIRHFRTVDWPFPLHNHNHYELMFIHQGRGIHQLNGTDTVYEGRTVFFLSPDDEHHFLIREETQFSVIKFLPSMLKSDCTSVYMDYWDSLLGSLVRRRQENYAEWNSSLNLDSIHQLIHLIIGEWQRHEQKITELHPHLIRSVLLIMKNNITHGEAIDDYGISTAERIQNFIHKQIHFPERLTVHNLSKTFGLSGSHLRALFKKETALSLTDYIQSLKFQMIKDRMESSHKTLTEISQEFGFSDSSHFNKFFQKKSGVPPKLFCKQVRTKP